MIAHVNHDLTNLAFETHKAKNELENSVAKLSSGKRLINAGEDAGGYQQAATLGSKNRRDVASMQNLQNLVSYTNTQDGGLQAVEKILQRMNTLAMRALDVTSTDSDRENYNKEFMELSAQLDEIKAEKFNDLELFGAGGFSDEKEEFIQALKDGWLKRAEQLITDEYGWSVKPADNWDVIVNENGAKGGYWAFVRAGSDNAGNPDVIEMQFDLPDFSAGVYGPPHEQPTSQADRVVVHEMVHVMLAQNTYGFDLTGDGTSSAQWFNEGLAELIHGQDSRILGILGAAPTDGDIDTLLGAIGTGNESWTTNEQYASAYLAARYLHSKIIAAGQTSGVKHLTQWMRAGFDNGNGAAASGLDKYFQTFLTSYADTNAFLADFKGTNGRDFVKNTIVPNLSNADTGSIRGSDAGGGSSLDGQDVVPDTPGKPDGGPVYEEEKGSLAAGIDGTGNTWDLQSVNTITVGDTANYNLGTISSARATLTQLTSLIENLATERSLVGANLSRLEKEIGNLNGKIASGEMAVSRIEDADVARESTLFATNQVRMQASVAILAQGRQTNVMLADLIRGVQVGG